MSLVILPQRFEKRWNSVPIHFGILIRSPEVARDHSLAVPFKFCLRQWRSFLLQSVNCFQPSRMGLAELGQLLLSLFGSCPHLGICYCSPHDWVSDCVGLWWGCGGAAARRWTAWAQKKGERWLAALPSLHSEAVRTTASPCPTSSFPTLGGSPAYHSCPLCP